MERLIYFRVEPIIDPLLTKEKAGFRRRRLTVYQATTMTKKIEDSYSAKKKTGAVFINLTAAYRNKLTHVKEQAKRKYYQGLFLASKHNMKFLWKTINDIAKYKKSN